MALATQCPHCHTTFRVAHDQLKLRAGLVRCGACKQIFNGIENLLHSEGQPVAKESRSAADTEQAAIGVAGVAKTPPRQTPEPPNAAHTTEPDAPSSQLSSDSAPDSRPDPDQPTEPDHATEPNQSKQSSKASDPVNPVSTFGVDNSDDDLWWKPDPLDDDAATPAIATPTAASSPAPETPSDTEHAEHADSPAPPRAPDDPLLRMTLMDFRDRDSDTDTSDAATPPDDSIGPDPLDQAMEDLQRKPVRGTREIEDGPDNEYSDAEEIDAFEEPSFVLQGRRRQRFGRMLRITMLIGSLLLLLALLTQAAYVFRDHLSVRFPQAKPVLQQACAYLGCRVGLPAQIEAVSIESSELQTLAPNSNTFGLTVLLRNRSAIEQAWPHIELTLNDVGEKPVARRAFAPAEYLPSDAIVQQGFSSQSEQSVRLFFELDDLKASGYRVYLFYP